MILTLTDGLVLTILRRAPNQPRQAAVIVWALERELGGTVDPAAVMRSLRRLKNLGLVADQPSASTGSKREWRCVQGAPRARRKAVAA